jgi:ketosteroid isomerase-like protein
VTTDDATLIANVLSDYCWFVDRLDIESVLALFATDAEFDLGLGRVFAGRDELRRLYERLDVYSATSHHTTNPRITVDGDTATSRVGVYAHHQRHDGSRMTLWGVYLDELVRDGGRWLIGRRVLRASMVEGGRPDAGRDAQFEPLPRG